MQKYTVLICDDDAIFADKVKQLIKCFSDVFEVEIVNDRTIKLDKRYDAYFLDIEMPTQNGFEIAEKITNYVNSPLLLFLTTHEELSMEGYEYQAFRFISKNRIAQMFPKAMQALLDKLNEDNQYMDVKSEGDLNRVYLRDIYYLYSEGNYLNIILSDKCIQCRFTIKEFNLAFINHTFACPQKGMLINLRYINNIQNGKLVILNNDTKVKISRNYKESFLETYCRFK